MEKTAPSEKTAVILEIGTLFSKMGFSGDGVPKKIMFTPPKIRATLQLKGDARSSDKEDQELEHSLEELIHQFCYLELLIQPRERSIFLVKNSIYPSKLPETFYKVCKARFGFTKIYCIDAITLPLYSTGSFTGIVIDIGYTDTRIQPVIYEGYPIQKADIYIDVGGRYLSQKLEEQIVSENKKLLKLEDLEDIKVKYLILLLKNQKEDYFSKEENIEKMKEKKETIVIRKKNFGISLYTRVSLYEDLFGDTNEEDPNIASAILDSLLKCDVNCRKKLVQNIVLAGGGSHIPNLAKRLTQELGNLLDKTEYKSLGHLKEDFAFANNKFSSTHIAWTGGSVLSQLQSLERFIYNQVEKV